MPTHVLNRWEDPQSGPALIALMRASISNGAAGARMVALFDDELSRLFKALDLPRAARAAAPWSPPRCLG
jgi:hypothetical protein